MTFDSPDSAVKLDTMSALTGGIKDKNFFLHYEFPPYATNETGRAGVVGRRELGESCMITGEKRGANRLVTVVNSCTQPMHSLTR